MAYDEECPGRKEGTRFDRIIITHTINKKG
jgi:hypothetical protein